MRPAFLDQHAWWSRTPRESLSRADYASPLTRYVPERAWRTRDLLALAVVIVAALAALPVLL